MQRLAAALLSIIFLFSGCSLFHEEPAVPAYLKVDGFSCITDSVSQGTNRQQISDVYATVGNAFIGGYQIPVTFPTVSSGLQHVTLQAGVKTSGTSTTRVVYPFFLPLDTFINLDKQQITSFNPVLRYRSNTKFKLLESFDYTGTKFEPTTRSSIPFHVTFSPDSVYQGRGSLAVSIPSDTALFECQSKDKFSLPAGQPVWLEIHYRNDVQMSVGLIDMGPLFATYRTAVFLAPHKDWNKVYIYLNDAISASGAGDQFKVFIGALNSQTSGPAKTLQIDNIKLLTLE